MKKNYKYFAFISIITTATCSSCYPGTVITDPYIVSESRQKENFYYVPSAPNAPIHSQKNDLAFNLVRTSDSKYSGADVQASYMPGKQIGVMGSYSFANSQSNIPGYVKYNRFELGSGFVTQFSNTWHFETYAGFGNGKISNSHYTGSSNIHLTHFFLQPAICISDKEKNIQFAFVSRFAGVNFKVTDTSFNNDREPFSTTQVKSLYAQPFHVMWEPGLVFRAGWKNFQFHTGYSFSADLTNPDLYKANGNFSMGICLRINTGDEKLK